MSASLMAGVRSRPIRIHPLLSFLAVLLGQRLTRRSARELETWRRREETMRMLRWSAESATSDNAALSSTGVAVLGELTESELLQEEDRDMVRAIARVSARLAYAQDDRERYDPDLDVVTRSTSHAEDPVEVTDA
ncbi:hypothetical protein [Sanguibacter keddieii]|nr:hypothetical protein [Sanguibacter keddieii]